MSYITAKEVKEILGITSQTLNNRRKMLKLTEGNLRQLKTT